MASGCDRSFRLVRGGARHVRRNVLLIALRCQDQNPGTSSECGVEESRKGERHRFRPGDRILLRAARLARPTGAESSGAEGAPIVFDRYGSGPEPRIDGAGKVEDAIRLYNVENIEVRNLEVTNHGAERAVRRGVHIFLDNFGTAHTYRGRRPLHP